MASYPTNLNSESRKDISYNMATYDPVKASVFATTRSVSLGCPVIIIKGLMRRNDGGVVKFLARIVTSTFFSGELAPICLLYPCI